MTRSCWRASGGTIYATSTRATKPKQPCGCTTITTSKSLALVDDKSAVQLTRYTTDRNNFKLHAAGVGDMFTPIETSLGALLLHSGVTHFLANDGKILGCSGILRSSIRSPSQSRETSLPSLVGIACSAPLLALTAPFLLPTYPAWTLTGASALSTIALGALTGWGTKAGCGCTSGHMLIGLSRLSYRSLVAVAFFFPSALATAAILWRNSLPGCSAVPCYHPTYPSSATTLALLGLVGVTQLFNNTILPRLLYSKAQASTARSVVAFVSGLEFGLGLLISGMASPLKVLRFFAFAFDWSRFDPSLAMVIIFGIIPNLVANTLVLDFSHPPKLDSTWKLPETKLKDINGRFLLGSVAFGVAWGLSGVCPGPGILQAVLQPAWGVMWTAGFLLGSLF